MIAASIVTSIRRFARGAGLGVAYVLALAALAPPPVQAGDLGKPGELTVTEPARPVPELTITGLADEQPASLAAYKGKPLLVNLWATWCGPCIKEMPSLVKLASEMKDTGLAVVAISEDRGGKFVVDPFLKDHAIDGLPIYLDKKMSTMKLLKSAVLPMTLIVDADGQEVGRVLGDRDWDSPESKAEIAKLLGIKAG
jgi:thiol-disulfide isomerase/thioredoxin